MVNRMINDFIEFVDTNKVFLFFFILGVVMVFFIIIPAIIVVYNRGVC